MAVLCRANLERAIGSIVTGRQALSLNEIGWWRTAVALGLYFLLLVLHPWLFGVSPFGIV